MLSRFDRKGNAGFALTELTVCFLIRTTEMTAVRMSDTGMEYRTPSSPNRTGSSERQPPKKQSGGTVKPVPPLALLKRQRETP